MSILLVIVGISALIFAHELGHFLSAKLFGVKVEEFGFGFPPRLASKKIGETRYSINLLPFGGFVRLSGENLLAPVSEQEKPRSFSYQPVWRRIIIIVSGVAMNFLLGWFIISGLFVFGVSEPVGITMVFPDAPAAKAGLKEGDRIAGFGKAEEFVNFVNENKGKEIVLNIKRGEENLKIKIMPRLQAPEGQGALGIGVGELGFVKLPLLASLKEGFFTAAQTVWMIFIALMNLIVGVFTGTMAFENFVGPVGIFQVAAQAGEFGFSYLFSLIGMISLNLMVLNILPFPALDGGRLLFVLVEKIKGSPLPAKAEAYINAAGFVFLLLLMIAITVKDVIYLF
ncbi:MAG: M50 family metallopeptidase [Patescibacteria group bacterium]